MKDIIESKVQKYVKFIVQEYYELYQLKLDYFSVLILINGFPINENRVFLTTSGIDEKINERIKLLSGLSPNKGKTIIDSYFLKLAKLFETSKDRPISIPSLCDILNKNKHLFNQIELDKLLNDWSEKQENNQNLIDQIVEHRNKCLAHNDAKIECQHLDSISTNETDKLIELVFSLINEISPLFKIDGISKDILNKMESATFKSNYELMQAIEKENKNSNNH